MHNDLVSRLHLRWAQHLPTYHQFSECKHQVCMYLTLAVINANAADSWRRSRLAPAWWGLRSTRSTAVLGQWGRSDGGYAADRRFDSACEIEDILFRQLTYHPWIMATSEWIEHCLIDASIVTTASRCLGGWRTVSCNAGALVTWFHKGPHVL